MELSHTSIFTDGVIDRLFTSENDNVTQQTSTYEEQLIMPINEEPSKRPSLMKTKLDKIKHETGWQKITKKEDLP